MNPISNLKEIILNLKYFFYSTYSIKLSSFFAPFTFSIFLRLKPEINKLLFKINNLIFIFNNLGLVKISK